MVYTVGCSFTLQPVTVIIINFHTYRLFITSAVGMGPLPTLQSNINYIFSKYNKPKNYIYIILLIRIVI